MEVQTDIKTIEVTLMLHSNERIIKHKVGLRNLAEELGNAFIGHRKSTTIRGQLYDNENLLATFTGARISGGGAWAGFKGSCSVLGRTVEVLGKDVAAWLTQPTDNAHLGD